MNVTLAYQYDLEEFVDACKAEERKQRRRARNLISMALTATAIVAAMLFMLSDLRKRKPAAAQVRSAREWVVVVGPWALVIGGMLGYAVWQHVTRYRRQWEKSPELHRPQSVHIDDLGINTNDGVSATQRKWDAFLDLVETRRLFLLYLNESMAIFIPKRAFTNAEQVDEFRTTCMRNIGQARNAFPVESPRGS